MNPILAELPSGADPEEKVGGDETINLIPDHLAYHGGAPYRKEVLDATGSQEKGGTRQ